MQKEKKKIEQVDDKFEDFILLSNYDDDKNGQNKNEQAYKGHKFYEFKTIPFFDQIKNLSLNSYYKFCEWRYRSEQIRVGDQVYFMGQKISTDLLNINDGIAYLKNELYKTVWFSYRNQFHPLKPYDSKQQSLNQQHFTTAFDTDSGWGCMIRVGQMIFAEALQRHLNKRSEFDKKAALTALIVGFLDNDEGKIDQCPYSIQKIIKISYEKFAMMPGEWYTPNRILFALQYLHQGDEDDEKSQKNAHQLKGYEDLRIKIFMNDRPLILEDLLKAFCGKAAKCCSCKKAQAVRKLSNTTDQNGFILMESMEEVKQNPIIEVDEQNFQLPQSQFESQPQFNDLNTLQQVYSWQQPKSPQQQQLPFPQQQQQQQQQLQQPNNCQQQQQQQPNNSQQQQQQPNNSQQQQQQYKFPTLVCENCHKPQNEKISLALFIACKIGLDYPEEKYLNIVNNFLAQKYSIGAIGGKPNKALYFIGRINNDYMYLDPHYVQPASTLQNFDKAFDTYFYKELLTYSSKSIDTSLAFGFYLRNLQQLEEFHQFLQEQKKQFGEDFFIWMENSSDELEFQLETQEIGKEFEGFTQINKQEQVKNKYPSLLLSCTDEQNEYQMIQGDQQLVQKQL